MSAVFHVNNIELALDPDRSPETVAFFKTRTHEDMSAFDLATALMTCDKTRPMPKNLFDLIVDLYSQAAELGNHFAMNDLGALYYDGRGCCQDFTKAVFYYEKAAELGNRTAQENLGYCYYYGRTGEPDYEKAYHYFALGALSGMPISLYKIGDMYQNGFYVEKNEKEAFLIYDYCMRTLVTDENASMVAGPVYLRLGKAFLYGLGTEKNAKNALICLQNAERFLFDMVSNGARMYRGSLQNAIEEQAKARKELFAGMAE